MAPLKLASANADTSYNAFMQTGETHVSTNATSSTHAGGITGPNLQSTVTAAHALWQPAYDAYNTCLASSTTASGGGATTALDLAEKNFPTLYFIDNQTVTASWVLNSDDAAPAGSRFPGIFSMDVKVNYAVVSGVNKPVGYTFTKPRVQMLTGESEVEIQGFIVRVNGAKLSGTENFLSARNTARRIDPVVFFDGSIAPTLPQLLSSDRISVSFGYMVLRPRTDALVIPMAASLIINNPATRTANLSLGLGNDSTARRWCLTTVNARPASTASACPGYETNAQTDGWLSARPNTFNLSDMGPLPGNGEQRTLYVWVANSDLKVSPTAGSAVFHFDNQAPAAPSFSVSVSDTQIADISNVSAPSENVRWCVKESGVQKDLDNAAGCAGKDFLAAKPTMIGLAGGGVRYVKIVIMDDAGNTAASALQTVTNSFGRISYAQLAGSGPRAVFTNRCASCHASGQANQAKWNESSYADAFSKKTQILSQVSTAPSPLVHASGFINDKERALINLWFSQSVTPVEQ